MQNLTTVRLTQGGSHSHDLLSFVVTMQRSAIVRCAFQNKKSAANFLFWKLECIANIHERRYRHHTLLTFARWRLFWMHGQEVTVVTTVVIIKMLCPTRSHRSDSEQFVLTAYDNNPIM